MTEPAHDLVGEIAVVTGAGRGVGRAIAQRLGGAGAVVCLMARTGDEIESVAAAIERGGGKAVSIALDVTDRSAVQEAFGNVDDELGPVSVLVNNAGTLDAIGPFWEIDPDAWWREVEIHLRGTLLCTHAALAAMVPARSGRVINVVGLLGQRGEPYSTAYTSAKAAIYRLTECLSSELQESGVRVFSMSPGPVRTRMTQSLVESDEGRRWLPEFRELSPEEWMPAEEGAELAYRLARGDADELSGRAMHVANDMDELLADTGALTAGDRMTMRILP